MPVPISVTHPNGKGIAAANLTVLASEGPFARAARLRAEAEAATAAQTKSDGNDVSSNDHDKSNGDACETSGSGAQHCSSESVVVNHLSFSYPGLGTYVIGVSSAFILIYCVLRKFAQPQRYLQFLCMLRTTDLLTVLGNPLSSADGRPIEGVAPLITDMDLQLKPGTRCLLVGANGAGALAIAVPARASCPCSAVCLMASQHAGNTCAAASRTMISPQFHVCMLLILAFGTLWSHCSRVRLLPDCYCLFVALS